MYLAVLLLDKGINLIPKTKSRGPDVHAWLDQQDVWIEAVAPREGSGRDAVPFIEDKPAFEAIPEDRIILRFTSAISEKFAKWTKYVEDGTIRPSDPFIVALNGRGIEMTVFDGPLPAIVKAVYPVGSYQLNFDRETLEVVSEGYQTRFQIHKASGASVPTNTFLDPVYAGISGVLYSSAALWDMPLVPGSELLYIHNWAASSRLPHGWLCGIHEYFREGDHLRRDQTPPCA